MNDNVELDKKLYKRAAATLFRAAVITICAVLAVSACKAKSLEQRSEKVPSLNSNVVLITSKSGIAKVDGTTVSERWRTPTQQSRLLAISGHDAIVVDKQSSAVPPTYVMSVVRRSGTIERVRTFEGFLTFAADPPRRRGFAVDTHEGTVEVFDLGSGKTDKILRVEQPRHVALDSKGNVFVSSPKGVTQFDVNGLAPVVTYDIRNADIMALHGNRLFVSTRPVNVLENAQAKIRAFDIGHGGHFIDIAHFDRSDVVAMAGAGEYLFVLRTSNCKSVLYKLDFTGQELARTTGALEDAGPLAVSNEAVFVGNEGCMEGPGDIIVLDAETLTGIGSVSGGIDQPTQILSATAAYE